MMLILFNFILIQEELDEAYKQKLEQNRKEAEERTAKNKAKRLVVWFYLYHAV